MSKRSGDFVSLDELLDDIGVDATRWFMLWRSHETTVDLDLELARSQSSENPVYYVQYAHARIASILRKAGAAAERGGRRARRRAPPGAALEPSRAGADQAPARVPRRGARGGRAPGAAPDLRLLDRGRRRLPRLLPRLPGGRRRGRGGRALAAGALPADEADDRRARSACSGSPRPSGCDAAAGAASCPSWPRSPARRRRARAWALRRADLEALARSLRAARRTPASVLVTGGEAMAGGDRPRRRRRRGRRAARPCSSATSRAPRLAAELGPAPASPGLHEYLRWEATAPEILQPLVLAGPAAGGRGRAAGLRRRRPPGRRRRRPCSSSRASATRSPSCAPPTSCVVLVGPPLETSRRPAGGDRRAGRRGRSPPSSAQAPPGQPGRAACAARCAGCRRDALGAIVVGRRLSSAQRS